HALWAPQIQNWVALTAKGNTLERRGEKTATPQGSAGPGAARSRLEHHETGQIAGFAAKSIGGPGPHCWSAGRGETRIHKQLRGAVVEYIGRHTAKPADFIYDL